MYFSTKQLKYTAKMHIFYLAKDLLLHFHSLVIWKHLPDEIARLLTSLLLYCGKAIQLGHQPTLCTHQPLFVQ